MKYQAITLAALALVSLSACKKNDNVATTIVYPDMAEAVNPAILFTTAAGVKVYNGGYGSAVAADPTQKDVFYMLTDRGSNVADR